MMLLGGIPVYMLMHCILLLFMLTTKQGGACCWSDAYHLLHFPATNRHHSNCGVQSGIGRGGGGGGGVMKNMRLPTSSSRIISCMMANSSKEQQQQEEEGEEQQKERRRQRRQPKVLSSFSSFTTIPTTTITTRKNFLLTLPCSSFLSYYSLANLPAAIGVEPCLAFEGGVGGLGKTKPQTGVIFYNPELLVSSRQSFSSPGIYSAEIVRPESTDNSGNDSNNTPILISFYAPWPMLKSDGIESRDLTSTESAFVQVATKTPTGTNIGSTTSEEDGSFLVLTKEFFEKSILSLEGKYGMYGLPTGIKVQKLNHDSKSQTGLYILSFTTMTPAMRESDRKVFVSTKIIGNGVYMLVTGTTAARFKGQEALLRKVAESFECIEAPKSKIRGGGSVGSGGTVY